MAKALLPQQAGTFDSPERQIGSGIVPLPRLTLTALVTTTVLVEELAIATSTGSESLEEEEKVKEKKRDQRDKAPLSKRGTGNEDSCNK